MQAWDQLGNYIWRGLITLALTLLIASGAGMLILHAKNLEILSVQSDSMVPVFRRGDALIVAPVILAQMSPGQVISYHSPHDNDVIVSHRLLAVDTTTGRMTTSGDALGSLDQPVTSDRVVGRAVAVAPRLGLILDFITSPAGAVTLIYIPALLLLGQEVQKLAGKFSHVRYRLYKY